MSSATPSSSEPFSSTPSASTWEWRAEHSLFYNPARNLWAQYNQETGDYTYLPSDSPADTQNQQERGREEGEISDEEKEPRAQHPPPLLASRPHVSYDDPSLYAFPSSSLSSSRPPTITTSPSSTLRLLLLSSSCLPPTQTLALLSSLQPDGYTLGRDKQLSPEEGRIRLREMEVSKSHAILYHTLDDDAKEPPYIDRDSEDVDEGRAWDRGKETGGKWWMVDSGSVHGTYIRKDRYRDKRGDRLLGYEEDAGGGKKKAKREKGNRLSESKMASLPAQLEHGDQLTVGSTVFEVHLHPNFPCSRCTSTSTASLIPTSFVPDSTSVKPSNASSSAAWKAILDREHGPQPPLLNPREKLKKLKAELLSVNRIDPSPAPSVAEKEREYRDRASLRREAFPNEPSPPSSVSSYGGIKKRKPNFPTETAAQTSYSALPSTNLGHALLSKQGWTPGTALGSLEAGGRTEPIQVKRAAGEGRKGLGVKAAVVLEKEGEEEGDWRDQGKERRWREMGLK